MRSFLIVTLFLVVGCLNNNKDETTSNQAPAPEPVNERPAPFGYGVRWSRSLIVRGNDHDIYLRLSAAEVGSTYIFKIKGPNGKQLYQEGLVAAHDYSIGPLDLSSFADGQLTVSLRLRNTSGDGPIVSATSNKDLSRIDCSRNDVLLAAEIGDVCDDGSIFAGDLHGRPIIVSLQVSENSMRWDNVNCNMCSHGFENRVDDGRVNVLSMLSEQTTWEGDSLPFGDLNGYNAARYCDELVTGGKTDWYLPARDELSLLFENYLEIGLAPLMY